MTADPPGHPYEDHDASWDAIVAALEEDVRRSEAEALERSLPASTPDAVAPSQSLLPYPGTIVPPMPPLMPSPASMPAVPADVVERIRVLQERIDRLTSQLQSELVALRTALSGGAHTRIATAFEPPSQPRFFDGRA